LKNSADVVRKISALISAGLPTNQAKDICAAEISDFAVSDRKQFDLVWGISVILGGPIVLALNRMAEVFDRNQNNATEVQLAFAGPQSTAKLVMWLPALSLVLAQLVGMNPLAAIFGSILGALSVSLGAGLMVAGRYWTKRLLARALPNPATPEAIDRGAYLDCVLIGLQAGLPLSKSRQIALAQFESAFGVPPLEQNFVALDSAAELSRTTGAALSEILSANADAFRSAQRFEISSRISRLGVQLMIPLGVAVLPAFVLLSIVPIAISLLSQGQL
jgi:tight adherence protein B